MRNEKNILRHEIIGLHCKIVDAKNTSLVGIEGKVLDETMKTLVLGNGKRRRVQKEGSRFQFTVNSKKAVIDGTMIAARPEDRIKKKFKKW